MFIIFIKIIRLIISSIFFMIASIATAFSSFLILLGNLLKMLSRNCEHLGDSFFNDEK